MSVPRLQHVSSGEYLDIGLAAGSEGGALFTAGDGASSCQFVDVGDIELDREEFATSGVHGVFSANHGARGRAILWQGNLRLSVAGLAAVLAQRDAFKMDGGRLLFIDVDESEYDNCRLERFEIFDRRSISDGDIVWLARYEIELRQLEV